MGSLISQFEQSSVDDEDVIGEDERGRGEQQIESAICDTRYGIQESL
jgi:hypothetical protein